MAATGVPTGGGIVPTVKGAAFTGVSSSRIARSCRLSTATTFAPWSLPSEKVIRSSRPEDTT